MMADICGAGFEGFFNNTILPMAALATIATSLLIAISFMVGRALANPKLTLWAKTEALQIVISLSAVFFVLIATNAFCNIDMGEIADMFELTNPGPTTLFEAAEAYLVDAAKYAHNAMTVCRYHLEAFTVLAFVNSFNCDFGGLGCLFGFSGTNLQPFGGYGATNAALNIFFNSSIISFFSAMNFLFILLYVYKGFLFLFLPLGIFVRSLPYLRSFGSLLMALAMSFLIVYPLLLSVFWLMGDTLLDRPNFLIPSVSGVDLRYFLDHPDCEEQPCEKIFPDVGGAGTSTEAAFAGADAIYDDYFTVGSFDEDPEDHEPGDNVAGAIMFAANAFVAAVFLPTVALIATIASVSYLARLYGEEIDLSRITQLV